MSKRYNLLKEKGLCTICGKVSLIKGIVCECCRVDRNKKQIQIRNDRRNRGVCLQCQGIPLASKSLCAECLKLQRERNHSLRKDNQCHYCGKPNVNGKKRCDKCLENEKRYSDIIKTRVFAQYGNRCACCGECNIGFLSMDHINNDGAAHRKAGITGLSLYRWLERNGYPKDNYQLLCFNCNMGKRVNGGFCPHVTETKKLWVVK